MKIFILFSFLLLSTFILNCEKSDQSDKQRNSVFDQKTIDKWSKKFRNWHHYPDFVVTADFNKDLNFTMVDGPNVFRFGEKYHMFYFGYDENGYQSCLAESDDLIHWKPKGLVMSYGKEGAFDYGGVVFVAPFYDTFELMQPPRLKKYNGKYWVLYGCYPVQGGYELGSGAQGLAWSSDGLHWSRDSDEKPILSAKGADAWENKVIYSPCLIKHEGKFWNFYNAKGVKGTEQIGFATSPDLRNWQRYDGNPIIKNDPKGYDAVIASNPEIYWDEDHWTMFYFGASKNNEDGKFHAHQMVAFSTDLVRWKKHPEPIFKAGGHPNGLDNVHAHNPSLIYNEVNDTFYQ